VSKRLERPTWTILGGATSGAPDPRILEEALQGVVDLHGLGKRDQLRLIVGRPVERRRSTLLPLRISSSSGSVSAVYKICQPRWKPELAREGLKRSPRLTAALAALGKDDAILPAPVLAVDPGKLTIVTLVLPGRPLDRGIRHVATSRWRGGGLALFRRIGRAARLIEQSGQPSPTDPLEDPEWSTSVERDLEMAASIFSPREVDSLHAKLSELYQAGVRHSERTYSHGDLSRTNILVSPRGIGLIDFGWQVRLRGFDLASFMYRMEYETFVTRPWITRVSSALLEGYGDPDITSSPSWNFYRLTRLLRRATRSMEWFHNRRATIDRARRSIRTELERV
jgi:Ser/Thr protein kinase RdoA (MazF antagonist)